jgi:HPt (histidine-containing phosphotransfer) domain-containing protein
MSQPRYSVRVPSELRHLIPRFLENRRDEIDQLRGAMARRDFEEARKIGHTLKGAGGGYGFHEITRLGGEIERLAVRGEDLAGLVDTLAEYLAGVEITFE